MTIYTGNPVNLASLLVDVSTHLSGDDTVIVKGKYLYDRLLDNSNLLYEFPFDDPKQAGKHDLSVIVNFIKGNPELILSYITEKVISGISGEGHPTGWALGIIYSMCKLRPNTAAWSNPCSIAIAPHTPTIFNDHSYSMYGVATTTSGGCQYVVTHTHFGDRSKELFKVSFNDIMANPVYNSYYRKQLSATNQTEEELRMVIREHGVIL